MKTLFLLTFLLVFLACNSDKKTEPTNDSVKTDTIQADGTEIDTSSIIQESAQLTREIKTYKGLYILGNELSTFRDCNTGKIYWLEDESKKLSLAYKKHTEFLNYPYESIYIEIKGYLKGKSNIGYAQEYENVLVVTDVLTSKQKSFKTECFNYEFIGLGNEPFWSLEIIPSEKLIALKDAGNEKTYTFPYRPGKSSGISIVYESTNDKGENIKAIIKKETCSDGMSDRIYSYSMEVTINSKTLKGCAIKKSNNLK